MTKYRYFRRLLIVAVFFLVFFAIAIIGLPIFYKLTGLSHENRTGLLWASVYQNIVLFILPSIVAACCITRRPIRYLQLNTSPSFLNILGVILGFIIALPALNQIIYWNSIISFPPGLEDLENIMRKLEDNAATTTNLLLTTPTVGGLIINLVVIALITAFGEELFFRGTLQNTAASGGWPHASIWIVALLFSAFHFQFFGFVPRLLMGAWFGYLLFWTRSVYVPIIAHFINNGVVVTTSWLSTNNILSFNADRFGVTEYGFPIAAFISAVAFMVFIYYFKSLFFSPRRIRLNK